MLLLLLQMQNLWVPHKFFSPESTAQRLSSSPCPLMVDIIPWLELWVSWSRKGSAGVAKKVGSHSVPGQLSAETGRSAKSSSAVVQSCSPQWLFQTEKCFKLLTVPWRME